MNDPTPYRKVWTSAGCAMEVPDAVADIIDDLLAACEGFLKAESREDTLFAQGKMTDAVRQAKPPK